jgi:hypothetical protein
LSWHGHQCSEVGSAVVDVRLRWEGGDGRMNFWVKTKSKVARGCVGVVTGARRLGITWSVMGKVGQRWVEGEGGWIWREDFG